MRAAEQGLLSAALLALASPAAASEARVAALLQQASSAYREQRLMDALHAMSEVIELEPENPTAKNYIWVITKKVHKKELEEAVSAEDVKRGLALASENMERRRRRTQEIVGKLRDAHESSRRVRSPQDVLTGLEGLERFMGGDFDAELGDEQSRVYFDGILSNLSEALKKGVFLSEKDHLRAEGYLAYFQQDLPRAAELWQRALDRDPADAKARADLEALKKLLERRARQEKIDDLSKQAWIHMENGDFAEAAQAWAAVLALDPENPAAREQASVARVAAEKSQASRKLKEMTRKGVELYNQGDPFGAAQLWLEVLHVDPTFEEARSWLQHAGRRLKGAQPARTAARPAPAGREPARDARKAADLYREGVVAYAQGFVTQAIDIWRQSVQLDPGLNTAREALRQAEAELSFQ